MVACLDLQLEWHVKQSNNQDGMALVVQTGVEL